MLCCSTPSETGLDTGCIRQPDSQQCPDDYVPNSGRTVEAVSGIVIHIVISAIRPVQRSLTHIQNPFRGDMHLGTGNSDEEIFCG
ncbi:unnamed protein product [Arctogadus glacialis]